MASTTDLLQRLRASLGLEANARQIRLRLQEHDDLLLPLQVCGREAICGGLAYEVACLCGVASVELKAFIAQPAEIAFVNASGGLRLASGIVTEARIGDFDGGLALIHLTIRDALAVMDKRTNSRIFRRKNELEVIEVIFNEWRVASSVILSAFDFEFDPSIDRRRHPQREQIMQHNETDAAFIRRLLKRRGISWCVRPGRTEPSNRRVSQPAPAHTLVLFERSILGTGSQAAPVVRYHREDATDNSDVITSWSAVRKLQPGRLSRHSWDYKNPRAEAGVSISSPTHADQGPYGSGLAATLDDYLIEPPHAGDGIEDFDRLGQLRLDRHALEMKCFQGAGNVRDFCAGYVFELADHPEVRIHAPSERQFVVTEVSVIARNNLPDDLLRRARSAWAAEQAEPVQIEFTAVRTGIPLVPHYDPRTDLPSPQLQSAIVVGPEGEEVYCDPLGRVKVRFPGMRPADHKHDYGAGASDGPGDSAWVRVMSNWAGNGPGTIHQCGAVTLPRVGTEVLVAFLGGDPDRPVILGQVYNQIGPPPALSTGGGLQGNRYQAGLRSREVRGQRGSQLRFDDTPGQISAQLACDHGTSELNLGHLTSPRTDGDADPRGHGAELRTRASAVVRGNQGVLITAEPSTAEADPMLGRAGLDGLAELLASVVDEVGKLAETHSRDEPTAAALADLSRKLKGWDTKPEAIVGISAPAGVVVASPNAVAVGSESKVNIASGGDLEATAGRRVLLRAARGLSAFAHALGIRLTASQGDISLQTHHGDVEIKSSGRIRLVASEGIDIQAPNVRVVGQGAQTDWGSQKIIQQSAGEHLVKASSVEITGPGGGNPAALGFPSTTIRTDERLVLRHSQTGEPLPNVRYAVELDNGEKFEGVTDQDGQSDLLVSNLICGGKVTFFRDEDAGSPTEAT